MKWCLILMALLINTSAQAVEKWRGLLEIQPKVFLTLGFNLDRENNSLTLDSPNQGMFATTPSEFNFTSDSVNFKVAKLQAEFTGKIKGGQLVGTFTQGRAMPITLQRLSDKDLANMQFEGAYTGELDINGKPLPLVLQVAVVANGFYTSLDSPAQQSFGIPVTEFNITAHKMTFASKMIGASFSGEHGSDGYKGSFVQGFELPLTLKKKQL